MRRPSKFPATGTWQPGNFSTTKVPSGTNVTSSTLQNAYTRTFLHIGAANYRTFVWVNTRKVCEHEGGFSPFDCELTSVLKDGKNFIVLSVDNTRIAEGVPTLNTDWWNYGGLTRDVSLVEVPTQFIDDYDLHLSRTDHQPHPEKATSTSKARLQERESP